MTLHTLGGLRLGDSGFTRPKPLLLLCYLRLEGAKYRRHLGELFFAGAQDPMNSLRKTVMRLRQQAPGTLEEDGDPLRTHLECDAQTLLTKLDAGELEEGVALYAGSFLAGLHLPDWSVELEEWVYATREFIASRVRGALLTLAERQAARAEFASGARLAERACWLEGASEPEPEEFLRLGALLAAGQSPLFARLHERARAFEIELNPSVEDARRSFRARPASTSSVARADLPPRGTSFVGRATERRQIAQTLAREDVRLLTITGPGGIGKTRLAVEVAREVPFRHGVVYVSLEAMNSLSDLPRALADKLGMELSDRADLFAALVELLAPQHLLVVLDSVEHLLSGASRLPGLLHACPNLKLLVTSRERLALEEEWVFPLGGLEVVGGDAKLEQALECEAVQLFAQRAKRARLDFNLTANELPDVLRICAFVGGSPLGIELAAAWVKLMPVTDIADEIERNLDFLEVTHRDASDRHRSLRAVFEQTWGRLPPHEGQLLARLSAFRGGFSREAASEVAGANLAALSSLVDKSLVRTAEFGRHDLHVLLGQFAGEMLAKTPEDEQRTLVAHSEYFSSFSERARQGLLVPAEAKRWNVRIDQDLENIRTALNECLKRDHLEPATQLIINFRNYWTRTGRMREARRWLGMVLARRSELSPGTLAAALRNDGEMALGMSDPATAQLRLEESLAVDEARGVTAPLTLLFLGATAVAGRNWGVARQRFEQALAGFREKGIVPGIASALNNLGSVLMEEENFAAAIQTFEQALRINEERGEPVEAVLLNLGQLHHRIGDLNSARTYQLRALQGFFERGSVVHSISMLEALSLVASAQDQPRHAAVLLGAGEAQREAIQLARSAIDRQGLEPHFTSLRAALGEGAYTAAWNEGRAMNLEDAVAYALGAETTS